MKEKHVVEALKAALGGHMKLYTRERRTLEFIFRALLNVKPEFMHRLLEQYIALDTKQEREEFLHGLVELFMEKYGNVSYDEIVNSTKV